MKQRIYHEPDRFLSRALGYSHTPIQGDSAKDRSHWTRSEPPAVDASYQEDVLSRPKRIQEMTDKLEQKESRAALAGKVAKKIGTRAFRMI